MDDDLVRDGRVARLETIGHRSGLPRTATVGFVAETGDRLIVAARSPDAAWARNLEAEPRVTVTVGPRSVPMVAELLADGDPRRSGAIRELILRYGTPSEALGRGAVFLLHRDVDV